MSQPIDVRKLLLTKPIINAAIELNPSVDLKGMKLDPSGAPFPLSRLEENAAKGTDSIPAITVKPKSGYYSIVDGRHRAAIAIANGLPTIDAIIQEGGRRRTKKRSRYHFKKSRRATYK